MYTHLVNLSASQEDEHQRIEELGGELQPTGSELLRHEERGFVLRRNKTKAQVAHKHMRLQLPGTSREELATYITLQRVGIAQDEVSPQVGIRLHTERCGHLNNARKPTATEVLNSAHTALPRTLCSRPAAVSYSPLRARMSNTMSQTARPTWNTP